MDIYSLQIISLYIKIKFYSYDLNNEILSPQSDDSDDDCLGPKEKEEKERTKAIDDAAKVLLLVFHYQSLYFFIV